MSTSAENSSPTYHSFDVESWARRGIETYNTKGDTLAFWSELGDVLNKECKTDGEWVECHWAVQKRMNMIRLHESNTKVTRFAVVVLLLNACSMLTLGLAGTFGWM